MITEIAEPVQRVRSAERFNLAADSRTFDCKFIEPGIISYQDHEGGGIELLRKETIDRCINSAVGNPITIGHVWVTSENRLAEEHGIIQEVYYCADDGWYHVKGSVDTPRAQNLMKVKKPSCGYSVREFGPGGTYHGLRYNKEIKEISFNHLAIVDHPRYEEAAFRLNSIINPSTMNVFKLLKKIVTRENDAGGQPKDIEKTESFDLPGDTEVTMSVEGKEHKMRLNDLGTLWMKQTAAAATTHVNGDDEVEVDGKKVRVHELIAGYRAHKAHEESEAKRKNDLTEESKKAGESSFFAVHAAINTTATEAVPYAANSNSREEQLKRGRARF
jgi:hypothetical protein